MVRVVVERHLDFTARVAECVIRALVIEPVETAMVPRTRACAFPDGRKSLVRVKKDDVQTLVDPKEATEIR